MTPGPELDELSRRLVDLADSGGPWEDPLPEVRRRAASTSTDPHPASSASPIFRSPVAGRRPPRWLRWLDPAKLGTAAAVIALVAGLGWLIRSSGPSSEKASSGSAGSIAASSAGGTAARSAQSHAAQASTAAGCAWPTPTLTLRAPATVRAGTSVSVRVRLSGPARAGVDAPVVVVMSNGRVVGRLVPTVAPAGPRPGTPPPSSATFTVTGTLRSSTCAEVTAGGRGTSSSPGLALPAGRYQLIAVATALSARVVSAPVTVTVVR